MAGPSPDSWEVDPSAASARELVPGLWRLRLPWAWDTVDHVNAYLLTDGREHVLVDCGPTAHETCAESFDRALAAAGLEVAAIDRVVLTHGHSDHVGQVGRIVQRSGAEVWLHPDTAHVDEIVNEPERSGERRMNRARAEGAPEAELAWFGDVREEVEGIGEPLRADHELRSGVTVPTPIGPLEVIETPGHAPSQVALVQPERGIVILGDTLCSVFVPWYDYGFSPDPVAETLGSLRRLAELGPARLALPGHGRPLPDLPAAIDQYQTGIARELAAVRGALDAGPAGAYELGRRAFGRSRRAFATFARTNLAACYLRHLRLLGEVTRSVEGDGRLRHHPRDPRAAASAA